MKDWHAHEKERIYEYHNGMLASNILGYQDNSMETGPSELPRSPDPTVTHLRERERSLASLVHFCAVEGLLDTDMKRNSTELDWTFYARAPQRQIAKLMCLPRSLWHDEYMFIRTIHATECCFAGILATLRALPPFIRHRSFAQATDILGQALFFSDFLMKLFDIFHTMPRSNFFDGFRVATGNASAIQSERFQAIEVLTRGLGQHKRAALSHQREVRFASTWEPPRDATLAGMCEIAKTAGDHGNEFLEVAGLLDQDLLSWRTKHISIARQYLPPESKGTGNEGIPYLAANFKDPRSASGRLIRDVAEMPTSEALARVSLSFGLQQPFDDSAISLPPHIPVGVVAGTSITEAQVRGALSGCESRLKMIISEREKIIDANLAGHASYFGKQRYPVSEQLARFKRAGALPSTLVPAFLLSLELRSGMLCGLHNTHRIKGQIVFDTASADESFEGIRKVLVKCFEGEPIVRDNYGIIASVFQGPDQRTSATLEPDLPASWTALAFGFPGMQKAAFDMLMADVQEGFMNIGASNVRIWRNHE
jgi:hypothetical protein